MALLQSPWALSHCQEVPLSRDFRNMYLSHSPTWGSVSKITSTNAHATKTQYFEEPYM
jgi:hypothetical protein